MSRSGAVASIDQPAAWVVWPKRVSMFAVSSIGAPISPIVGMKRGTRRDRYSRVPKRTALTQAMKPGPSRKVQSRLGHECVAGRGQRGRVGGGAGEVLAQGDHGEQGDDPDQDDGRLDHAGHDEPEGQ